MTQKKDLKRRVRERMARTGERYAAALRQTKAKVEPGLEADFYSLQREAEAAGLKCQVMASRTVYRWSMRDGGRRLLARLQEVLAALESDASGVLFRRAMAGEPTDVESDARAVVFRWRERLAERLRYARRLELGLRGVSADGCILSFEHDGHLVVASLSLFGPSRPGSRASLNLDAGAEFIEARELFDPVLPRLVRSGSR